MKIVQEWPLDKLLKELPRKKRLKSVASVLECVKHYHGQERDSSLSCFRDNWNQTHILGRQNLAQDK